MSTADSATSPVPSLPNAELISGLRDLADFLERHPELPAFRYADVNGYITQGEPTEVRATLRAFAQALGERATESYSFSNRLVTITAEFGRVAVALSTKAENLVDAPPEPDYEPIIGEQS